MAWVSYKPRKIVPTSVDTVPAPGTSPHRPVNTTVSLDQRLTERQAHDSAFRLRERFGFADMPTEERMWSAMIADYTRQMKLQVMDEYMTGDGDYDRNKDFE